MVPYFAQTIKDIYNTQGLSAAQNLYRALFISTQFYATYKAGVDLILTTDGYSDCIVTE